MIDISEIRKTITEGFSKGLESIKDFFEKLYKNVVSFIVDVGIILFYFLYFIFSWIFTIVVCTVIVISWTILKLFKKDVPPLSKMIRINMKR